MPGPCVYDAADLVLVTVGEHLAPVHRPQHLEELLAAVGVSNIFAPPQNIAEQVTVLLHQVITAAIVLTQAVTEVRLGPGSDGVAGVEVAVGQEAAGEGVLVIAPVVAALLDTTQLLAHLAVAPLVTGKTYLSNNLIRVRLALCHRQQGALGLSKGQ